MQKSRDQSLKMDYRSIFKYEMREKAAKSANLFENGQLVDFQRGNSRKSCKIREEAVKSHRRECSGKRIIYFHWKETYRRIFFRLRLLAVVRLQHHCKFSRGRLDIQKLLTCSNFSLQVVRAGTASLSIAKC